MNKDFVLDFVAGGMDYPVYLVHPVYIPPSMYLCNNISWNVFSWRCVCCSKQDGGGSTGEGEVVAPDSGVNSCF